PLSLSLFTRPSRTPSYPLSLHDALPISTWSFLGASTLATASTLPCVRPAPRPAAASPVGTVTLDASASVARGDTPAESLSVAPTDRKSTRLNSSHGSISYAVFCLKKKKQ